MTRRRPADAQELDLTALRPSWELHMRAERKSPQTIKTYGDGVRRFFDWCERNDHRPALTRSLVVVLTADLLDGGAEPTTLRSRQLVSCARNARYKS